MNASLPKLDREVLAHNLSEVLPGGLGLEMPRSYVVFDLETTSLEVERGAIWQFGLYPVLDGTPLPGFERGKGIVVKTDERQLRANDFEIARRAKARGESLTKAAEEEYLMQVACGMERVEAFQLVAGILQEYVQSGFPIIGHNMIAFDVPFFEYDACRVGVNFKFPADGLIDTGMLIKSALINRKKLARESPRAFYHAVSSTIAKGAYYAIARFCIPYWDMPTRFGVDVNSAHDAGYDCWLTALTLRCLMEEVS